MNHIISASFSNVVYIFPEDWNGSVYVTSYTPYIGADTYYNVNIRNDDDTWTMTVVTFTTLAQAEQVAEKFREDYSGTQYGCIALLQDHLNDRYGENGWHFQGKDIYVSDGNGSYYHLMGKATACDILGIRYIDERS